jgi:hypothetical protein
MEKLHETVEQDVRRKAREYRETNQSRNSRHYQERSAQVKEYAGTWSIDPRDILTDFVQQIDKAKTMGGAEGMRKAVIESKIFEAIE